MPLHKKLQNVLQLLTSSSLELAPSVVDKLIDAGSGWLAISPGLTDRLMAEWGTKLRGPLYEYKDLNFWTNKKQILKFDFGCC